MSTPVLTRNRVLFRGLILGALAVTAAGLSAVAQPGGPGGGLGGGGISPEDRAKVETAQAQAVAASLKLDAEKAGKLAEAYSAGKKAAAEKFAAERAAGEGREGRSEGGGRGDFEGMRKLQAEQQTQLQESFKAFLDEAQAKEAAEVLGGFNRQWDRLVSVILGFGLDEAKQAEALGHTVAFVKASAKARTDNAGATNMDAVRTAMAAAKKTLDEAIAPLLNDAQKVEWTEKTSRGPRGGGDRERRGRGDDGAGAPPAPPAEKAPN